MKRKNTLQLFKSNTVLFVALLFLLFNCQKDDLEINSETKETKDLFQVKKVNYEDLKTDKKLSQSLESIQKSFDFNKKKKIDAMGYSKISSIDSSFSILTDEIYVMEIDSTTVYTFRIETPTSNNSLFENFIIKRTRNNNYTFHINKFEFVETYDNVSLPYNISVQTVNKDQVNLGDFSSLIGYDAEWAVVDGCLIQYEWDYRLGFDVILYSMCFGGGGGGSSSTGGSSGNESNITNESSDLVNNTSTTGGSSSSSNNNDSNPFVVIKSPEAKMLDLFNSSLTDEQKDCLTQNPKLQSEIKTFLLSYFDSTASNMQKQMNYRINSTTSNTSPYTLGDAQTFSKLVLDNCGGEVDWGEHIINNLTEKANCVYEKLIHDAITNHNLITDTFIAFGESSLFGDNLIYNTEPNLTNKDGQTLGGKSYKIGNNQYITLNESLLDSRSSLEIATTILHESVHALLSNQYTNSTVESFMEIFKKYILNKTGSNEITHNIMRDYYVLPIANALKQFDNYEEDDSFYEILALEGINNSLTDEEKKELSLVKEIARYKGLNCN